MPFTIQTILLFTKEIIHNDRENGKRRNENLQVKHPRILFDKYLKVYRT